MHSQNLKMVETVMLQRFSAVADGMHFEVVVSKEKPEPLISFREDEDHGMQVILHLNDGGIAFPLAELERAIAFAREEVHKESFYG